jgi:glycosyltransferase involved in cell wall biosynthesis
VKLLIFAHTPPPHHGQSLMVHLLLEALGGDCRNRPPDASRKKKRVDEAIGVSERIECFHVNTRFSADISDLGQIRLAKFLLVFRYCFEAIVCRIRYGVTCFYFAPAPAKRGAFYRDLLVMLLCRPFFRDFIHHWHAVGLGDWLQQSRTAPERWLAQRLLGKPSMGITLARANLRDPLWFRSRDVAIVPNGIPDPFPDFNRSLLPIRGARLEARHQLIARKEPDEETRTDAKSGSPFRILYLAHCFREKGIFETLEGVALARRSLRQSGHPIQLQLTVAGDFASAADQRTFAETIAQLEVGDIVDYMGFVADAKKRELLRESDCLCFPTYTDSFGLVVLEAMASGLSIVATRWRALPEILPADYPGFVPIRDAAAIARVLPLLFTYDTTPLRERFLTHFTVDAHVRKMRAALLRSIHGLKPTSQCEEVGN